MSASGAAYATKRGQGKIINLASQAGIIAFTRTYCLLCRSKAAIIKYDKGDGVRSGDLKAYKSMRYPLLL